MKKIIVLLLVLGLLLAGCTYGTPPAKPNPTDDAINPADIPQPPQNPNDGTGDDTPPTLPF